MIQLSIEKINAQSPYEFSYAPNGDFVFVTSLGPSALSPQPSALRHLPSSIIHQPSAIIHQPSSIIHQTSYIIHHTSALSHQPSAIFPFIIIFIIRRIETTFVALFSLMLFMSIFVSHKSYKIREIQHSKMYF